MIGYKLTEDDKNYLTCLLNELGNITAVARRFCSERSLEYNDSSRRRVSGLLSREGVTKNLKEISEEEKTTEKDYALAKQRKLNKSQYYIITWEQNRSQIHENLWNNILAYKEFLGAELSVILGRYKNPTSVFTDRKYDTWSEETQPYWDASRHDIHNYVTILGDVKIQPTAANPLTGLESITGETTTIVGHPKMWLKTVPVLEGHPKKILVSTGAITLPNYTDSKAGKRGEFHHKLGFAIIEIKNDEVFFVRQVEADKDGNFIDLYYEVKDGQIYDTDYVDAIVFGDLHAPNFNHDNIAILDEITERLNPKYLVLHDLIDGESVNNHLAKNPVEQYHRMVRGQDNVEEEVESALQFLRDRPDQIKIVVQSNHNDRLDRWLNTNRWDRDLKNALPYLKYLTATLEGKAEKGILAYLIEEEFSENEVVSLDYDDSYMINGYEVAHHGHIGANGSRGNIEQFRKMSTKMIIGHSHSPFVADSVVQVGTLTNLREGYNKGASSWLPASCLIHKNGIAQLIIVIDNDYTTLK